MYRSRFLGIYLTFAIVPLVGRSGTSQAAAQNPILKVQIVADEMCCKGCAQKIVANLYAAPGVTSVEADVPKRLVTITAKSSPKLTLERLWGAVEQGKGGPSKLITSQATYVFTRAERLKPEQRLPTGRYSLQVRSLENKDTAQRIANQLYKIPGVQKVSVDMTQSTLFVQSATGASISPWTLASAAERANSEPIAIGGPYGVFTIERPTTAEPATAVKPSYPQIQGEVR